MKDVSSNLATIEECGYELVGHFKLPDSSWLDQFYNPLKERLAGYEDRFNDVESLAVMDIVRGEIDIFRRFSSWYGYMFFLLRAKS